MNLTQTVETFGQENQTWLDSAHGTDSARSVTIDITKGFVSGTHYPTGTLPSGIPLGIVTSSGKYGLYDHTASDGRQTFVGLLFISQKVGIGDIIAPMIEHCRVNTSLLPFALIDSYALAAAQGRIEFI